MPVPLTQQQIDALDRPGRRPVRLIDPRTNAEYVLLAADEYDRARAALDESEVDRAIRDVAIRNADARAEDSG